MNQLNKKKVLAKKQAPTEKRKCYMKKPIMFILFFCILSLALVNTSCTSRECFPDHIGISPSMELEVQEGSNIKYKPRIGSSIDWNF